MPANDETDSLPVIWVSGGQLPAMTESALASLRAANDPPELFVRRGQMVVVVRNDSDRHVVKTISGDALRGRLARSGRYLRVNGRGRTVECVPPLTLVRDVRSLPPSEWGLPVLDSIVETPFRRPDGTISDSPGYDPRTHLYHAPVQGALGRGDDESIQWETFVLALADVFGAEPFRVADLVVKLSGEQPRDECGHHLRSALPDDLLQAAEDARDAFRWRVGKSFSRMAGRHLGETEISIERDHMDRKAKVQRWRVQRP
jgi:hypothetical protein